MTLRGACTSINAAVESGTLVISPLRGSDGTPPTHRFRKNPQPYPQLPPHQGFHSRTPFFSPKKKFQKNKCRNPGCNSPGAPAHLHDSFFSGIGGIDFLFSVHVLFLFLFFSRGACMFFSHAFFVFVFRFVFCGHTHDAHTTRCAQVPTMLSDSHIMFIVCVMRGACTKLWAHILSVYDLEHMPTIIVCVRVPIYNARIETPYIDPFEAPLFVLHNLGLYDFLCVFFCLVPLAVGTTFQHGQCPYVTLFSLCGVEVVLAHE